MVKIKYSYKNQDGKETFVRKSYDNETIEYIPVIELLATDFKNFLRTCGYSDELIGEYLKDFEM